MADRQKMFGPTGGFSIGWPIQLNHAKFCGPTLVAMATKFWAIFSQKSPISRLVCQIDRIRLGLPGETSRGPISVANLPWQRHLR